MSGNDLKRKLDSEAAREDTNMVDDGENQTRKIAMMRPPRPALARQDPNQRTFKEIGAKISLTESTAADSDDDPKRAKKQKSGHVVNAQCGKTVDEGASNSSPKPSAVSSPVKNKTPCTRSASKPLISERHTAKSSVHDQSRASHDKSTNNQSTVPQAANAAKSKSKTSDQTGAATGKAVEDKYDPGPRHVYERAADGTTVPAAQHNAVVERIKRLEEVEELKELDALDRRWVNHGKRIRKVWAKQKWAMETEIKGRKAQRLAMKREMEVLEAQKLALANEIEGLRMTLDETRSLLNEDQQRVLVLKEEAEEIKFEAIMMKYRKAYVKDCAICNNRTPDPDLAEIEKARANAERLARLDLEKKTKNLEIDVRELKKRLRKAQRQLGSANVGVTNNSSGALSSGNDSSTNAFGQSVDSTDSSSSSSSLNDVSSSDSKSNESSASSERADTPQDVVSDCAAQSDMAPSNEQGSSQQSTQAASLNSAQVDVAATSGNNAPDLEALNEGKVSSKETEPISDNGNVVGVQVAHKRKRDGDEDSFPTASAGNSENDSSVSDANASEKALEKAKKRRLDCDEGKETADTHCAPSTLAGNISNDDAAGSSSLVSEENAEAALAKPCYSTTSSITLRYN